MPASSDDFMDLNIVTKYLLPLSRKGINKASESIATNNKNQKVIGRFFMALKSICPSPSPSPFVLAYSVDLLFPSSTKTDFGLPSNPNILLGFDFLLRIRDSCSIFYFYALLRSMYARSSANIKDKIIKPRPINKGTPTF